MRLKIPDATVYAAPWSMAACTLAAFANDEMKMPELGKV